MSSSGDLSKHHASSQQADKPRPSISTGHVSPMPSGTERMDALKNLGATFEEGQRRVSKVATPTETEFVPSFVDTAQLEELAQRRSSNQSLQEAAKEASAD